MNLSHAGKYLVVAVIVLILGILGWRAFKQNIGSVSIPGKEDIAVEVPSPLPVPGIKAPEGFVLSLFAKELPGARSISFDPKGRMLVSETGQDKIAVLEDADSDGIAENKRTLFSGLNNPHGMEWQCETSGKCFLYVAESDKLTRFSYDADAGTVSEKTKLVDISYSASDNHFTRSLLFLPHPEENILLISVGSSCNVCHEKDEQHAKILSYDIKTGKLEEYARGLRNSVFLALNPVDGKVFATEMGRDGLGDNVPPDEINIIEKGKNYGWPVCYGKNIHDDNFDKNTYIRNPCMEPFEKESFADLQAHSAPLGLAFIPEEGWPEEYWYNILVAYHGSWNRSVPTGYKIARIKMNSRGEYLGTEDFITGWLTSDGKKLGRPVDIKIFPGGTAYISDDSAGVIYKLSHTRE